MLGDPQGKIVGLLGLSFKPNTDDMRDAPAIDIAQALMAAGASVRATDPVAMEVAAPLLPGVEMCDDVYEMARGCDALMVVTEWNEFKQLDLAHIRELMRQPVIFDGRNIYDPALMKRLGFDYQALGRGFNGATVFPVDAKIGA
jgi:UDPglucose 6-dehydrogenase